jgi:DNA polymerase-3 subunit epsilon
MTGGQVALSLGGANDAAQGAATTQIRHLPAERPPLKVIRASAEELADHQARLAAIASAAGAQSVWERIDSD